MASFPQISTKGNGGSPCIVLHSATGTIWLLRIQIMAWKEQKVVLLFCPTSFGCLIFYILTEKGLTIFLCQGKQTTLVYFCGRTKNLSSLFQNKCCMPDYVTFVVDRERNLHALIPKCLHYQAGLRTLLALGGHRNFSAAARTPHYNLLYLRLSHIRHYSLDLGLQHYQCHSFAYSHKVSIKNTN